MGTGPVIAMSGLNAATDLGREVAGIAGFDITPEIIDAIEAGTIAFTVDQQQYLQGYMPVLLLYLYVTNQNTAGGGLPILTGPGFVTPENAARSWRSVEREPVDHGCDSSHHAIALKWHGRWGRPDWPVHPGRIVSGDRLTLGGDTSQWTNLTCAIRQAGDGDADHGASAARRAEATSASPTAAVFQRL